MRASICYISGAALVLLVVDAVGVPAPRYLGYQDQTLGNHLCQSYLAENDAPHVRLKQNEFISKAKMD